MGNLFGWLIDSGSAGGNGSGGPTEQFHFYIPWLAFCVLSLLFWFYYQQEARKRFFGSHSLNKALLDRFTAWLWPLALVGLVLLAARFAEVSIFGLRFWRYAWALWAVAFFGYCAYYMIFKYPAQLAAYRHHRTLERYKPQPKNKRRRAVRA